MKLQGKVAIVTGGANGLGKETCELFAKEGAVVIIADCNFEAAVKLANEIVMTNVGSAMPIKVDVSDEKSVANMVSKVMDTYGKIDILINNAGITQDKTLLKMTLEQWLAVLNVNLTGVFNCAQAVAPHMVKQGYGRIINTSSVVGKFGNIGQSNYAATKAGVIGLTQTWAKELGRKGINVNAVAPGFIATDMTKAMPEEVLNSMKEKVFMRRLGLPIEVANTYLFLSSEESSYINGAVISIDGGLSL